MSAVSETSTIDCVRSLGRNFNGDIVSGMRLRRVNVQSVETISKTKRPQANKDTFTQRYQYTKTPDQVIKKKPARRPTVRLSVDTNSKTKRPQANKDTGTQ